VAIDAATTAAAGRIAALGDVIRTLDALNATTTGTCGSVVVDRVLLALEPAKRYIHT
jgi:hypothetical protein